jgi:tripartite ATP-independent transporter DctM subunit
VGATPAFSVIVLIIGGIMTGIFTATEAGAVAVAWTAVIGFGVYGELKLSSFWDASYRSMIDFGSLMIIFAITAVYSFMVVATGIPAMLIGFLLSFAESPTVVLFMIVIGLLLLGMILDPIVNIILVVPVLAPNFGQLGIDPLHTGVVMVLALMIGLLTPPVGGILFVLERVTDVPLEKISRALVPYYVPLMVVLVLIIVFPQLVTFLPSVVG